jgi:hypothetical protein
MGYPGGHCAKLVLIDSDILIKVKDSRSINMKLNLHLILFITYPPDEFGFIVTHY